MMQTPPHPLHRFEEILREIQPVIAGMDPDAFFRAVVMLDTAPRIFLAGAGRSGLLMRMFAMRLMQVGCAAAVAGECTTPSIQQGDVLVVSSGSGNTATMRVLADIAAKMEASLLLLTYSPDSVLAGKATHVLSLPVPRVNACTGTNAADGTCHGYATGSGADVHGGGAEGAYGFGGQGTVGAIQSHQILGTLFDQVVQFTSTLLVEAIARRRGETNRTMQARHANLE